MPTINTFGGEVAYDAGFKTGQTAAEIEARERRREDAYRMAKLQREREKEKRAMELAKLDMMNKAKEDAQKQMNWEAKMLAEQKRHEDKTALEKAKLLFKQKKESREDLLTPTQRRSIYGDLGSAISDEDDPLTMEKWPEVRKNFELAGYPQEELGRMDQFVAQNLEKEDDSGLLKKAWDLGKRPVRFAGKALKTAYDVSQAPRKLASGIQNVADVVNSIPEDSGKRNVDHEKVIEKARNELGENAEERLIKWSELTPKQRLAFSKKSKAHLKSARRLEYYRRMLE
jgi:hypothetical protein